MTKINVITAQMDRVVTEVSVCVRVGVCRMGKVEVEGEVVCICVCVCVCVYVLLTLFRTNTPIY